MHRRGLVNAVHKSLVCLMGYEHHFGHLGQLLEVSRDRRLWRGIVDQDYVCRLHGIGGEKRVETTTHCVLASEDGNDDVNLSCRRLTHHSAFFIGESDTLWAHLHVATGRRQTIRHSHGLRMHEDQLIPERNNLQRSHATSFSVFCPWRCGASRR